MTKQEAEEKVTNAIKRIASIYPSVDLYDEPIERMVGAILTDLGIPEDNILDKVIAIIKKHWRGEQPTPHLVDMIVEINELRDDPSIWELTKDKQLNDTA